MRSVAALFPLLAATVAMGGEPSPTVSPLWHYVVFELDGAGVPQPQGHRLVRLAAPRESLSEGAVAATLASTPADRERLAVRVHGGAGEVVFRDVAEVARFLRTEHGAHGEDGGPEAFFPDSRAFVVRVPEGRGSHLSLTVAGPGEWEPATVAEREFAFDLGRLASDPGLPLAAYEPAAATLAAPGPAAASAANRLDLLVMGDGYTAAQSGKFATDAASVLASFFALSPYSAYRSFVQTTTLFTPSNQSGADHPPYQAGCAPAVRQSCCADTLMQSDPLRGTLVDTAFDGTYCSFNTHRLAGLNRSKALLAAAAFPDWDQILMLLNDTTYGGSGGVPAVTSLHALAPSIAQHEYGHSFTVLADEYSAANPGYPACDDLATGPACEANVTNQTSRSLLKWAPWVLPATPVPTPDTAAYDGATGLFQGARYLGTGMYRPERKCRMNLLADPFCRVCSQAYVLRLYRGGWGVPASGIDPIEPGSESPAPGAATVTAPASLTLGASLLTPEGGPLSVAWLVDGVTQTGGVATTATATTFLFNRPPGRYTVQLVVQDPTPLVNATMAGSSLRRTRSWTVTVRPLADLGVTLGASRALAPEGATVSYTAAVTNLGPDAAAGAAYTWTFPASIGGVAWTCSASAGSTCPASGSGNASHAVSLLAGGSLAYAASGTVGAGAPAALVSTASVASPAGLPDPSPANNSATSVVILEKPRRLHTVAPCRIVDTRGTGAPIGGPALAAGVARTFVLAGQCGISATAAAVSATITVTGPEAPGDLRLFPGGSSPALVSAINYGAGQTRANNAVAVLGAEGAITVLCGQGAGIVHFILDVNGYFE